MKLIKKIINLILLNLLTILCCIPVVTAGAAVCASFYSTLKLLNDESENIFKTYFKGFKASFKQGTLMWCITAPSLLLGIAIWKLVLGSDSSNYNFIQIAGAIVYTAIFVFVNLYSYPMIARYNNTLMNIIRNSIGISFTFLWKTIFVTVLVVAEIFIFSLSPWILLAGIVFGPELVILTISLVVKPVFLQIERHEQAEKEEKESEENEEEDDESSETEPSQE